MTHPTVTVFGPAREIMHPPGDGMSGTICDHYDMLADHNSELDGDFMLVPVDAVVLSRQPCNNCDGTGTVHKDKPGIRDDYPFPCPSCGGSGTTLAPSTIYDSEGHVHPVVLERVESAIQRYPNMQADQWLGGVAAIRAVLDALVVQEGTDT